MSKEPRAMLARLIVGSAIIVFFSLAVSAAEPLPNEIKDSLFQPLDVFQLEYASDPRISPDGRLVVYVRNYFDIMKDRRRSNLWVVSADGKEHRPLTSGLQNDSSPRWSPDGRRIAYVSDLGGSTQLYCRWFASGDSTRITNLQHSPSDLQWSPDGNWLAFVTHVSDEPESLAKLPAKPTGAEWAEPAKVIHKVAYRADGNGYLKDGFNQVFVVPADGGSPRQLTAGRYDLEGPLSWTPDGAAILFSSNRQAEWELDPLNSEIYQVNVSDRQLLPLTNRVGPDTNPVYSPDGRWIAYLGFDDQRHGYEVTRLWVMKRDGSEKRCLTADFDRDVSGPLWNGPGDGLYFQFDDRGNSKVGQVKLTGTREVLAENVGGATIGRPYSSGTFSVSREGIVAFSRGVPDRPADVAVVSRNRIVATLTDLNADLLGHKTLGSVEEIKFLSSADEREIHAWMMKPPQFDATQKYPLLLEIHGGPFANYGVRFSAEMQLYAAAGYVVLYVNPRGSTSYGKEFGNLIHHNYPGQDFDDLMSGVDAVIQRGFVDERNLFVTGGSGGGILTAWIVGKTNRFRAAVSAKPVINWYSFVLTSDVYPFFNRYWFPGYPWEHAEHYLKRSPLSLVGNVATPTMLITGEQDYRTPISETEQFYQALKLRKIDTAMVRVPGASHDIAARPSQLISQVAHTVAWFERYRQK